MPRKADEPERFLLLDENLTVVARSTQGKRVRPFRRRSRKRQAYSPQLEMAASPPPFDSLMRTRKLIMAAVRVWELRNGIHDPA
ncbi:MAG TPA: hypothetical protein VGI60_14890 [Chthoniobacterales bacterium]|jgi:hypothetical protein